MIKKGIYRHYKGNLYEVIAVATHSETLEKLVVYKALYGEGEIWLRPIEMWEQDVTKDNKTIKRFEFVK